MEEEKKEDVKEKRVRALTKVYYSRQDIHKAIAEFSKGREVVPRYFEGFGKRPDTIQYVSDVMGLVQKGATSFHASEEIWNDPLSINSDMNKEEMNNARKAWDLLIDVDSPFFDISKEATKLIIETLERYGVKKYGIKYSGSKGFHIIVPSRAFPEKFNDAETKNMFPEWPRAIVEFIFNEIKQDFRRRVGKIVSFADMEKKHEKIRIVCKNCNNMALKGILRKLNCENCGFKEERRDIKSGKKELRCPNCRSGYEAIEENYFFCGRCRDFENEKIPLTSNKYPEMFEEIRGELAEDVAELDLVLVAPRHLFRMPYSLHEKTALASVVLDKEEIDSFSPKDAMPLSVKVKNYILEVEEGEAKKLLSTALEWKRGLESEKESEEKKNNKNYENFEIKGVTEEIFPKPIKKLLLGLKEGRKRGLFILITFLKSINFPNEYISQKITEWNKLNEPGLKEGYIKSQLEWHFRQKRKILPPNYDNQSFYKDLNLLDYKPDAKNPIVEVIRNLKKQR